MNKPGLNDGGVCPLTAPRLYETNVLRQATGATLRPGGLALLREALRQIDWSPGARVLDIGCGIGATAAYLRREHGLRALGLDLSARLLSEGAASHPDLPLVRSRAEELPVADGVLEGLTCECVLSLVSDPFQTLKEFRRVLTPGGRLILSDLYRRKESFGGGLPGNCCLPGTVSREQLQTWLEKAGFKILLWQDRSHFLAELAARLVLKHGSMAAFWAQFASDGEGESVHQAVQAIRPGYFLVLAEKS
jgi:arsenite methyltransferase